jgi:hypothetical protein
MKAIRLLGIAILFILGKGYAQDSIHKIKIFQTWVTHYNNPVKFTGVLYEIRDSSIVLSDSWFAQDYKTGNFQTTDLGIDKIEFIKVRRYKGGGRGFLIGAGSVALTFGIIAVFSSNKKPRQEGFHGVEPISPLIIGIPLSLIGGLIGAGIGSLSYKIPINRGMGYFDSNRDLLRELSIKK